MSTTRNGTPTARRAIGWLAVVSSAIYFGSDVLEASNGGFTTFQLWLTLIAEATLPIFILGLYVTHHRSLGRWGRHSAILYAAVYTYFTWTVLYALAHHVSDFTTLNRQLGPWMTIAGAVMVIAGITFGGAILPSQALPRWTGIALAVGVVLVVLTLNAQAAFQLIAVGLRDVAFIGMGAATLRAPIPQPPRDQRSRLTALVKHL